MANAHASADCARRVLDVPHHAADGDVIVSLTGDTRAKTPPSGGVFLLPLTRLALLRSAPSPRLRGEGIRWAAPRAAVARRQSYELKRSIKLNQEPITLSSIGKLIIINQSFVSISTNRNLTLAEISI